MNINELINRSFPNMSEIPLGGFCHEERNKTIQRIQKNLDPKLDAQAAQPIKAVKITPTVNVVSQTEAQKAVEVLSAQVEKLQMQVTHEEEQVIRTQEEVNLLQKQAIQQQEEVNQLRGQAIRLQEEIVQLLEEGINEKKQVRQNIQKHIQLSKLEEERAEIQRQMSISESNQLMASAILSILGTLQIYAGLDQELERLDPVNMGEDRRRIYLARFQDIRFNSILPTIQRLRNFEGLDPRLFTDLDYCERLFHRLHDVNIARLNRH